MNLLGRKGDCCENEIGWRRLLARLAMDELSARRLVDEFERLKRFVASAPVNFHTGNRRRPVVGQRWQGVSWPAGFDGKGADSENDVGGDQADKEGAGDSGRLAGYGVLV